MQQAKNYRMKISNTKTSRQLQRQRLGNNRQQQQMSSTNGLVSNMEFTPIQGLE